MRPCSVDGCTRQHRARGLCATHYNQRYQPNRHAASEAECVVCGSMVMRRHSTLRRPTCSVACRTLLQHGTGTTAYDWNLDAMNRARKAGATVVEYVDRLAVMERDNWTCYLCGIVMSPDADPYDLASPTVDHVIALTRGGDHSMANARAACLRCNSTKQDHAHAA